MLEEIRDTNDNYAKFTYTRDNNQLYPSQIVYTGSGTTDGIFTIDFTKSARNDAYISYETGFKVATLYKITQIQTSVNGQWVRKYDLAYTVGNNNNRSLLQSVQETGRDDLGTQLTLPAISFTYSSTSVSFVQNNPAFFEQVANAAHVVNDINGDGLPDKSIFYHNNSSGANNAALWTNNFPSAVGFGTQNDQPDIWAALVTGGYGPSEQGTRFFDVNGDGLADLVHGYRLNDGTAERRWYANTYSAQSGYAWTSTTTVGTIPEFGHVSGIYNYTTGMLGDVNGDGLVDYVMALPSLGTQDTNGVYLGNGRGFEAASTTLWSMPNMPVIGAQNGNNNQPIDINGDGLVDLQFSDGTQTNFLLNTGKGWGPADPRWAIATTTLQYVYDGITEVYWDRGIRFIDMNGDGLPDYVRSYTMPSYSSASVPAIEVGTYQYVYWNTGSGWATSSITSLPSYITYGEVSGTNQWQGVQNHDEYVDWTGDGITDASDKVNQARRQDVLTQITYPTTGYTQVEYVPSPQTHTNPQLPASILLVSKITNNDNNGNVQTIDYKYEDGRTYTANVRDRKLAGFSTISEIRTDGTTKTYYHQGNTASTSVGELADDVALIGQSYREEVYATSTGALVKRSFLNWGVTDQGDNGRK